MIDTLLGRPGSRGASVFDAIARSLVAAGIGPNSLTCTALALGLVAAALFFVDHGWWAMLVLVGSGLLDAVDGRVARLGRGATAWGGVLDLTSDRVVEAAVLLGVVVPHPATTERPSLRTIQTSLGMSRSMSVRSALPAVSWLTGSGSFFVISLTILRIA